MGLCDCRQRMWLPPRVSALLTRAGIKASRRQSHRWTIQSPDRQVKLAIAHTPAFLRGTLVLGLPPMFPLSCARARARTAFQPSAHSIFSVPTNLKSFHYYFEVIFALCPSYLAYDLERPRFPLISVTLAPCKVVDYIPSGPKFREHPPQQMTLITRN